MYKKKGVCIKKIKAGCHIKKWHQKVNRFLIYDINKGQLHIKSYSSQDSKCSPFKNNLFKNHFIILVRFAFKTWDLGKVIKLRTTF